MPLLPVIDYANASLVAICFVIIDGADAHVLGRSSSKAGIVFICAHLIGALRRNEVWRGVVEACFNPRTCADAMNSRARVTGLNRLLNKASAIRCPVAIRGCRTALNSALARNRKQKPGAKRKSR